MTQQARTNQFGPITNTVIAAQLDCGHRQHITAHRQRPVTTLPTQASNAKLLQKVMKKTTRCRTCNVPSTVTDARILAHSAATTLPSAPQTVTIPVSYTRNPGTRGPRYTGSITAAPAQGFITEQADSKEELDAKLARRVLDTLASQPLHLPAPPQTWEGAIDVKVPNSLSARLVTGQELMNQDDLSPAPPTEILPRTTETME